MDPLSITTGALALITTIAKVSYEAGVFVKKVRDARNDLDNVSRELLSLSNILELLVEDTGDEDKPARNLPEGLQKQIGGIIRGCEEVVKQVEDVMAKYEGGGMRKGMKWAMGGKNDMDKLQKSLEAHKTALDLALDMVQLTVSKEIKDNTNEIKGQAAEIKADTGAIRDDTALILAEIARLQERIDTAEQAGPGRTTFMLDKYLDGLTTYAETVIDGAFSDDGSLDFSSRPSSTVSDARVNLPPHEELNEEAQLEKLGEDHADLEALGAPPSYFEATTKRRADEATVNGEARSESTAHNSEPAQPSVVSTVAAAPTPAPPVQSEPVARSEPPASVVVAPNASSTPPPTLPSSSLEKAPLTSIEDDLQAALKAMRTQSNISKGFHSTDSKLPSSALMNSFDSLLTGLPKNVNEPLALPIQAPKETRVYLAQESGPSNNVPAPNELAKAKGERFLPNWFSQPSATTEAPIESVSIPEPSLADKTVPQTVVVLETPASVPVESGAAETARLYSPVPLTSQESVKTDHVSAAASQPLMPTLATETNEPEQPAIAKTKAPEPEHVACPAAPVAKGSAPYAVVAERSEAKSAETNQVPPAEQAQTRASSLTAPWDSSFPIAVDPGESAWPARPSYHSGPSSAMPTTSHRSPSSIAPSAYQESWQPVPRYAAPVLAQGPYQQQYALYAPQQYYPPPPQVQQPYYPHTGHQYNSSSLNAPHLSYNYASPVMQPSYQPPPSQYQQYQQPLSVASSQVQQMQTPPGMQSHRSPPPLPAKRPLSHVVSNPKPYMRQDSSPTAPSEMMNDSTTSHSNIVEPQVFSRTESLPSQPSALNGSYANHDASETGKIASVHRFLAEKPASSEEALPSYEAHSMDLPPPLPRSNGNGTGDLRQAYPEELNITQQPGLTTNLQPTPLQRRSTSPLPNQSLTKPIEMSLPPPPPIPSVFPTSYNPSVSSAPEQQTKLGYSARKDAKKMFTKDPDVVNKGRFLAPGLLLKKNYSGPAGSATATQQRACSGMILVVLQEHRFRKLKHHDALNLEPGDRVKVLKTFDGTWWLGRREKDNKVGWMAIPYLDLNHPEIDPDDQRIGNRPTSVGSSHSSSGDPRSSQPGLSQKQAFEVLPNPQDQPAQLTSMLSNTYNLATTAATNASNAHQVGVSELLSAARSRRERRAVGGLAARLGSAAIAAGSSAASSYMASKPEEKDVRRIEKDLRKAEKETRKDRSEHTEPALFTAPTKTATPLPPPSFESQTLFNGNRVVDIPLPKRLVYLARGDTGKNMPASPTPADETEFSHIRCSEITCAPLSLAEEGFALRPQLYASARETKLLIVFEVGKHDDVDIFVKKLLAMYEAIEYLCTPEAGRTVENWTQESWKNIVLFIFDKGYWKSVEITHILKDTGLMRDWTSGEEDLEQDPKVADHVVGHPTAVDGKDVRARLFEHSSIAKPTTAKGAFTGTRPTSIPTQTIVHTRIGELPDIHMKDLRRNDALPWINGLSALLQPSLCIYVQSTCVEMPKNGLVRTWKEFEMRKVTGKPTSNFPNTASPTIDFLQLQAGFWKKMWGGGGGGEWYEVQPIAGHEKINRFQLAVNRAKEIASSGDNAAATSDVIEDRSTSTAQDNRLSANALGDNTSPRPSESAIELPASTPQQHHRSLSPAYQQEHKAAWDAIVAAELPADQLAQASQTSSAPRPQPFVVRAIFAFQPGPPYSAAEVKGPDADLPFQEGQLMTVVDEPNHEWFKGWYVDESCVNDLGEGKRREGLFPQNFVERI